jgi:hypothetical protein
LERLVFLNKRFLAGLLNCYNENSRKLDLKPILYLEEKDGLSSIQLGFSFRIPGEKRQNQREQEKGQRNQRRG